MDDNSEDVRQEIEHLRQENAQLRKLAGIPPVPPKEAAEPVLHERLEFPAPSFTDRHESVSGEIGGEDRRRPKYLKNA